MLIETLISMDGEKCDCGKEHIFNSQIITGPDAVQRLPQIIRSFQSKKAYIIADMNTYIAAGKRVCEILLASNIEQSVFCYEQMCPEPDEKSVGSAFMHMSRDCDIIIGVGSGVINDISKIIAAHTKLPFIIVATAPSMDGYASMSSSVLLDGNKISLPSRCADVIIGDTEIIKNAPKQMILSGIGDMLAKYISICEWRIAAVVVGEYYCENIAGVIRDAVKCTIDNSEAALAGDEKAIMSIFDALIVGSVAMNYAGLSRPASGVEHYISHLFDIRGVEFGDPIAFHGTQCAIATLYIARLYEMLLTVVPAREKATSYVEKFDIALWNEKLIALLGKSAHSLIKLEKKENKYDKQSHKTRLSIILEHWNDIVKIIEEEIPNGEELEKWMEKIGMPTTFGQIGMREDLLGELFCASKDIRDKYVLSRLLWDIGVLDEFAQKIHCKKILRYE